MTAPSIFDGYGPDNPLTMSAAGLCKTFNLDAIRPLAAAADFVVIGSITLEPRAGNEGVCEYFDNPLYSVNSWGMPNPGIIGRHQLNVPGAEELQKKLIISLAEFSPSRYSTLFSHTWDLCGGVELNFGCPNVRDDGTQHKIISFDPVTMAAILDLIAAFGVAVTNTFPNGQAYTAVRKPALDTKQAGRNGGIGGEALKPISLSNAAQFRELLPDGIGVIRVGGISSGEDVWQSYDVGCGGVQVMTAVAKQGIGLFTTMRQQYADI